MNRSTRHCFILFAVVSIFLAQKHVEASVASSISKAISRYAGREGVEQAGKYAASKAGKEAIERVSQIAIKQGGEEAAERVVRLASHHGPEAIKALDNVDSLVPVLNALDEIPESQVRTVLTKLAAGESGQMLGQQIAKIGVKAIATELKHPGVGVVLMRHLGDDGAELATRMTTDQAIVIARHADEIAALPGPQRAGVLAMIRNDVQSVASFAGRFLEANPGKSLFTVATTAVILAEPDRILGGDEIVFDAEGNPVVVSKSGLVDRTIDSTIEAGGNAAAHVSNQFLQPLFFAVLVFVGTFASLWLMIKWLRKPKVDSAA